MIKLLLIAAIGIILFLYFVPSNKMMEYKSTIVSQTNDVISQYKK